MTHYSEENVENGAPMQTEKKEGLELACTTLKELAAQNKMDMVSLMIAHYNQEHFKATNGGPRPTKWKYASMYLAQMAPQVATPARESKVEASNRAPDVTTREPVEAPSVEIEKKTPEPYLPERVSPEHKEPPFIPAEAIKQPEAPAEAPKETPKKKKREAVSEEDVIKKLYDVWCKHCNLRNLIVKVQSANISSSQKEALLRQLDDAVKQLDKVITAMLESAQ